MESLFSTSQVANSGVCSRLVSVVLERKRLVTVNNKTSQQQAETYIQRIRETTENENNKYCFKLLKT